MRPAESSNGRGGRVRGLIQKERSWKASWTWAAISFEKQLYYPIFSNEKVKVKQRSVLYKQFTKKSRLFPAEACYNIYCSLSYSVAICASVSSGPWAQSPNQYNDCLKRHCANVCESNWKKILSSSDSMSEGRKSALATLDSKYTPPWV